VPEERLVTNVHTDYEDGFPSVGHSEVSFPNQEAEEESLAEVDGPFHDSHRSGDRGRKELKCSV